MVRFRCTIYMTKSQIISQPRQTSHFRLVSNKGSIFFFKKYILSSSIHSLMDHNRLCLQICVCNFRKKLLSAMLTVEMLYFVNSIQES